MNQTESTTTIVKDLYYLPPLTWFPDIIGKTELKTDGSKSFVKSSFHNRCYIGAANGKLLLSVPVAGGRSVKEALKDVRISYADRWQQHHWNSICSAYNKSTFFPYYEDHFRRFFEEKTEFLAELNIQLLYICFKILDINIDIDFQHQTREPESGYHTWKHLISDAAETVMPYYQVFQDRHGFMAGLSIIDLIFNLGPDAKKHLLQLR